MDSAGADFLILQGVYAANLSLGSRFDQLPHLLISCGLICLLREQMRLRSIPLECVRRDRLPWIAQRRLKARLRLCAAHLAEQILSLIGKGLGVRTSCGSLQFLWVGHTR